jgi:hypothetical protein
LSVRSGAVEELARRVPGVTVTEAVALWLEDLYTPDRDSVLETLQPDRLTELHVTTELAASPELAEACLTGLDPAQARRGAGVAGPRFGGSSSGAQPAGDVAGSVPRRDRGPGRTCPR